MTESSKAPDAQDPQRDGESIGILDALVVLARHKWLIVGFPLLAAAIAAAYTMLLMPNIYTASTKILPPQSQGGMSAALAQLGGFAGFAGGVSGIRNPNDLYIGMLRSRTVSDNIIQRFDLMTRYSAQIKSRARQALAGSTNIFAGKDGIITVEVDEKDPKLAADIANAYVDELFKLTKTLAVTEASQRRLFYERQLEQARDSLGKAEAAARSAMEKGGIVQVEGQGRAIVENLARLRGQITVKEVQIGAMRAFATERNPELQLAQNELASMRNELARLEGASGGKQQGKSMESGAAGIDSVNLLRNVKYYETIYELLSKQFEIAKIDEAKDSAVVQVMDPAIEPDSKSKPVRRTIVLATAGVALFLAILWIFVREFWAQAAADPRQSSRLQELRQHAFARK